jgi:nucleotide-binding universal stress UspA family protein
MKILLAYDGSTCADAAVADLRNGGFPRENEVLVVTVAHNGWPPSKHSSAELGEFGNPWNALMADTGRIAAEAATRIRTEFPAWKVSSEALWGSPAEIIKKTIDHWAPDLLVVGSHGRSAVGRLFLGSVSLDLVHHASCPVRVVRPGTETHSGPLRLLVASDGSPHADNAISSVTRRCWPAGTQVRVVSAVQSLVPAPMLVPALEANTFATEPAFEVIQKADQHEREHLRKAAEGAGLNLKRAGLDASAIVLDGLPWKEIVGEAERWHANAIFVGARGLGPMDRLLLGSVSTAVLNHAHCTVEVVR